MTQKTKLLILAAVVLIVGIITVGFGLPFTVVQLVKEKATGVDFGLLVAGCAIGLGALTFGLVWGIRRWAAAATKQ